MRDTYQEVTDRLIASMETAQAWQRPWNAREAGGAARPYSVRSGKAYRGINTLLLYGLPYSAPQWGTYKAWKERGAQVRKGERATMIVFWKQLDAKAESDAPATAKPRKVLLARGYNVFNAEQVDGYERPAAAAPVAEHERVAAFDAFLQATRADIRHGGGRAYYNPSQDYVQLPPLNTFHGTKTTGAVESYYSTALHELGHWTGHASRCARDFGRRFGDNTYAFEELVAELSAAFVGAAIGLETEPRADHASYLKSWLQVLREDNRAIFTAASKAQAAADHLLGLQPGAAAPQTEELLAA